MTPRPLHSAGPLGAASHPGGVDFRDSATAKVFRYIYPGKPALLRDALLARYRHSHSAEWAGSFYPHRVRLDGAPVNDATRVHPGQEIAYLHLRQDEPPLGDPPPVLLEDPWMVALHKPDSLPVSPSGIYYFSSLAVWMREVLNNPELTPIHRLDLETSGPLLFATRKAHLARFHRLFETGSIRKRYRALVHGHIDMARREITGMIVPDTASAIGTRLRLEAPGAAAIPQGTTSGRAPRLSRTRIHGVRHHHHPRHGALSEALLEPVTGKTNQLRVHLAAIGHPIVGDKKYHPDERVFLDWYEHRDFERLRERLLLPRQALQCETLCFPHPFTDEPVEISAPPQAWAEKVGGLVRPANLPVLAAPSAVGTEENSN